MLCLFAVSIDFIAQDSKIKTCHTDTSLFLALAPLLIKVWRMYKIFLASASFRRVNLTHFQAFLYTLPFIAVELIILTIFSFVGRPRPVEDLSTGQQVITCEHESPAFFATQLVYDGTYRLKKFTYKSRIRCKY